MRKPVFGVCNQVRFKPACSTAEASKRIETMGIEIRGIIPSRERITKMLDVQADQCCSHMAKIGFLMTWLK